MVRLAYEWNRPGSRTTRDLESAIDLFAALARIGRAEIHTSREPFWDNAVADLQRRVIKLLDLAREPISIASIGRTIESLPSRQGEYQEPEWQAAFGGTLLQRVRERQSELTSDDWADLDHVLRYAVESWPRLDERPRSSILFTWLGLASRFQFNPMSRLFCGGRCSFTPEDVTDRGKLVICDFPALEYGRETSALTTGLVKLVFMRAFQRRTIADDSNLAFLYSDEAQQYILPEGRDEQFLAVCRSARIAVIYLFQNLNGLAAAHGETQAGSRTKSLLASFGTKVFMANTDVETNAWAASVIGKDWSTVSNIGFSDERASAGESQQVRYLVDPIEFSRLRRADGTSEIAEAIVHQGGAAFEATKSPQNPRGLPYLRVGFSRT